MFEKLVVPLDGSDAAEIVLPYVTAIAGAFSTEIALITVVKPGISDENHLFQSYLNHVAQGLRRAVDKNPPLVVSTAILTGKASEEIVKYTAQSINNLIIIAGHGASGGNPAMLGSMAVKIVSSSSNPALLVKIGASADIKPSDLIKCILIPLDGSKMSEHSLSVAVPLARKLKAEIVLLQAIEPVHYIPGFDTMVPNVVLPDEGEIKKAATKYLEGIKDSSDKLDVKMSCTVIADAPAEAIIDYADSADIDVIAITTHGLSGVRRWVFGSTTEKVLQAAVKPVLIIPNTKFV